MLAVSAPTLPTGPDWTYEVKWDGYRALAIKDGARVRLLSRNQKDLTRDYPAIALAIGQLGAPQVVLDGELVAIDTEGRPSFQALQHRATTELALVYLAFDLLELDGQAWTRQPLDARRQQLASVVAGSRVLLSEPLPGSVREIERTVRAHGLEGIVAKRRTLLYGQDRITLVSGPLVAVGFETPPDAFADTDGRDRSPSDIRPVCNKSEFGFVEWWSFGWRRAPLPSTTLANAVLSGSIEAQAWCHGARNAPLRVISEAGALAVVPFWWNSFEGAV
jgi:hypothetical protein